MLQRLAPGHERLDINLGELALTWINHDLTARLIVDEQLLIIWGNTAARAFLARRRDIENRNGTIATVDRSTQSEFEQFIWDAGASASSWCLRRADGDGHLVFRAQRLTWGDMSVFGISFFSTGTEFRARYADLGVAFGLTRSENKVLLALLDGKDTEEVARCSSVSVDTVRSHIRSIYSKLEVNSREALFYRLRPYRL